MTIYVAWLLIISRAHLRKDDAVLTPHLTPAGQTHRTSASRSTGSVMQPGDAPVQENSKKFAYVISPLALFERNAGLLQKAGFTAIRIDPVEPHEGCSGGKPQAVYGCFLAHQKVWSLIKESDEPAALVLESDATTRGAPAEAAVQYLVQAWSEMLRQTSPSYLSIGHCGTACMTAYFINRMAVEFLSVVDACTVNPSVDLYLVEVCNKPKIGQPALQCTWKEGLQKQKELLKPCAECFGSGLFVQNRSIHGMHDVHNADKTGVRETRTRLTHEILHEGDHQSSHTKKQKEESGN